MAPRGCVCGVGGPCGTLVPAARYLRYLVPDTHVSFHAPPLPPVPGPTGRTSLEPSIAPSPFVFPPRCVSFRPALSSLIPPAANVALFRFQAALNSKSNPAQSSPGHMAHARGRQGREPLTPYSSDSRGPRHQHEANSSYTPSPTPSLSLFPACVTSPLLMSWPCLHATEDVCD